MTIIWQRRHWAVFSVLLACQAVGLWALASRGALALAAERTAVRVPTFLIWMYLPVWIVGSVFLTSVIVIMVLDTAFHKPASGKAALGLFVLWLFCVIGGVALWRLVR